jgi:hypothetical protein
MATVTPTQPLTTAAFLFGEGQDSVDALTNALEDQSVLGSLGGGLDKLSRPGRKAAGGQLASVAHGLLDLDLGDLAVGGWRRYVDLVAAARRTIATPDSTEVVELATHSITSTHGPSVEVLVNDVHVATVRFELCVRFAMKGIVATVQDGRLVALSGGCEVMATLATDGRQLAKREAHLPLPLLVRLGDGIPLLRGVEVPASGAQLLIRSPGQVSTVPGSGLNQVVSAH